MGIASFSRIFLVLSTVFSVKATAFANENYRIACYFNDTDESVHGQNPQLMWPSKFYVGARYNYYWALDSESFPADYTALTGNIVDGFFIEQSLTYDDVVERCNFAVQKGVALWPSKPSYKLYEFKASLSNLDGYEYPIQFAQDNSNKYKINKVVIFGDSLSDTGNLKRRTKILPYYPYWYGRFSNGFIWDDYFARDTHLPILNFAFGGAKTEGTNDIFLNADFINAIGVEVKNIVTGNSKDYINSYLEHYLTTDSYNTVSSSLSDPQNTLFVLWIGGNDYVENLLFPGLTQNYIDEPNKIGGINQVQVRTVQNIIDQIKALNAKGAYHFLIPNLPDIGKTPIVTKTSYKKYSNESDNVAFVSKTLSRTIEKHNNALNDSLKKLQESLGNKIDIVYLDINKDLNAFMQNKSFVDYSDFDYNYSQFNTPYQIPGSYGNIPDSCYSSSFYNAAFTANDQSAYDYASNYTCKDSQGQELKAPIFWDKLHPSSYTHCWVAYAIEKRLVQAGLISTELKDMNSYKDYCYSKVTHKDLME